MIILSHPNGNQNVRSVLDALYQAGELHTYFTAVGMAQDEWLLKLAPPRQRRQMRRRAYTLPADLMSRHPLREIMRLAAPRLKMPGLAQSPNGWAAIESVYKNLDETVAAKIPGLVEKAAKSKKALNGVYCYQDGAFETFRVAREQGLKCFYDLPTAHYATVEKLLDEEGERWPEWKFSMTSALSSPAKLERHQFEIENADAVYVPSQFVYDTIPPEIRQSKEVCIAEFGSPLASVSAASTARQEDTKRPLRVLFVGRMSQRKGLADLFEAMKRLNRSDVELVVLGTALAPIETYKAFYSGFRYEGPRPHPEVLKMMASCDVFAFPSIIEGRALVQQEALSQGLPLIVTKNAGAEDVIDEGKTGFLVPIRSPDAIVERINWFADHRAELPEMRELARAKAAKYTWQRYGKIIFDSMQQKIGA